MQLEKNHLKDIFYWDKQQYMLYDKYDIKYGNVWNV